MKLLLDTQSLIWWLNDDPKLGPRTRSLIAASQSVVLVSVVSFWEVSIKHRIGKLDERGSELMNEAQSSGFEIVEIEREHLAALETFVAIPGHKDPFDHLILIQAKACDAVLVTSDRQLRGYDVRCL